MTYDSNAQNKFANNAVELVIFRTGPTTYEYSSTHTKELNIGGNTYQPHPFNRGSKRVSNAFEDDGIKIILMPNHPICSHYRTMPTDYDVSVLVRQGYLDDNGNPTGALSTDYPILAMGWVGAYEFDSESGEVTLTIVTVGDTLSAPTLNRNFQQSCPLRLYGPKCKAVKVPVALSPLSLGVGTLTLAAGWNGNKDIGDFIGGLLSFSVPGIGTQYRMISQTTNTQIRFVGSSANLTGYTSISAALGCAHTLDACRDLHENSKRYGGFPWQPLENPVNKSIR